MHVMKWGIVFLPYIAFLLTSFVKLMLYTSPSPSKVSSRKRLESITEDGMTGPELLKHHERIGSDEVSILSNISWISQSSMLMSPSQAERMASFEKMQQERFERKKLEMGQKLSSVLDRHIPTVGELLQSVFCCIYVVCLTLTQCT
jgi:hypothetical protein